MRNNRAIFLDRDGTLVQPRHFPTRPDELVLFEGVENELSALQQAGFRLVVITNQSGIARGLFSVAELEGMHRHLALDLRDRGIRLDAIYFCPHHPEGTVPEFAMVCHCRKPAPGMLLSASDDLAIDLSRSWFVGDILDDIEAGNRAGCRTVLVDLGTERAPTLPIREPDHVAPDVWQALRRILSCEGGSRELSIHYVPPEWRSTALKAAEPSRATSGYRGRMCRDSASESGLR